MWYTVLENINDIGDQHQIKIQKYRNNIQVPIEKESTTVRHHKKQAKLDRESQEKSQTNKDCDQAKVTRVEMNLKEKTIECEYCDKTFSVSFTTINIYGT